MIEVRGECVCDEGRAAEVMYVCPVAAASDKTSNSKKCHTRVGPDVLT